MDRNHQTEVSRTTPLSDVETTPNKKPRYTLRQKLFAAAAGVTLAGTLAACGENASANPGANQPSSATSNSEVAPNQTQTNEPAPTKATPSVSPSSIETNSGSGTTIEQMKSMTFEKFNALDRLDQLKLFSSQLKEMDGFIGDPITHSDPTIKDENPLNVASLDNSGADILKQWDYSIQTALFQSDSPDLTSIDKESAKKMLAGSFYYTTLNTTTTSYYADLLKVIDSSTNVMVTKGAPTVKNTSEVKTGVDRKGNPIQYRDILAYDPQSGKDENFRFVYVTYKDFNDTDRGIWLNEEIVPANEQFTENF